MEPSVPNGVIVLIKKDRAYGAFVLRDQQYEPAGLIYEWYYRMDGKGTFTAEEASSFKSGRETSGPIAFGPFHLCWSPSPEGTGCLEYWHLPGARGTPRDQKICVTDATNVETIDATDSKWTYR